LYFSPGGGASSALVEAINESRETIDVEMYFFTSAELAEALREACARGVRVRVVLDECQIGYPHAQGDSLNEAGAEIRYREGPGLLHAKLAIFDAKRAAVGSYNWTRAAEERNVELVMFVEDPEYVEAFRRHFAAIWATAARGAEGIVTGRGPAGEGYVSSVNSSRFHYPSCPYASKIKEENLVRCETREEAVAVGKEPCFYCSP
ncbi:MAG TPA: phospholipase D-like domain-containing protein, partial [bacterium]|nr:phospholipase D-like domain-containing protein [bacterium]